MSTPLPPGWWLASDGRWYPPETHPDVLASAEQPTIAEGGGPEPSPGETTPSWYSTIEAAPPDWYPQAQSVPTPDIPADWSIAAAPPPPPEPAAPRRPLRRRSVAIALAVVVLVAAGVAVPLALLSSGPPLSSLPAAQIEAKALAAARSAGSMVITANSPPGGGAQFGRFVVSGAGTELTIDEGGGSSLQIIRLGSTAFVLSTGRIASDLDVPPALVKSSYGKWMSSPMLLLPDDLGSIVTGDTFGDLLAALALVHPKKIAHSAGTVTLEGVVPKSPADAGTQLARLVVSTKAPYLPESVAAGPVATATAERFTDWGTASVRRPPADRTVSMMSLLHGTPAQQAALHAISVSDRDLTGNYRAQGYPGGNLVGGQTTLDLCEHTYPSEYYRVARSQVEVESSPSATGLMSTEAVIYTSASATALALSELQAEAAQCPSGFEAPPEAGLAPEKTVLGPRPDASWPQVPGVERLGFAATVTASGSAGATEHTLEFFLRRGRVLLGVYFFSQSTSLPTAVAGQHTVEGLVLLLAKRVAALPPSATG